MQNRIQHVPLSSGFSMPQFGLGTWQLTGRDCTSAVQQAVGLGYTHIDTAEMYGNHREVGEGIKESGAKREELFITSKIWRENLRPKDVIRSAEQGLADLQLDYLDLLLIHWPHDSIPLGETFGAFGDLVDRKKVRSIGVSNFTRRRLGEAIEVSPKPVTVNQIECHPYLKQEKMLDYSETRNVVITAYSPLARRKALQDDTVVSVAGEKGKEPAQIILRWQIQRGVVIIPKASSEKHLKSNIGIFGWELSENEMRRIDRIGVEVHRRLIDPGFTDFREDD